MEARSSQPRILQALRASLLFGGLGEPLLERLAARASRRTLARGEHIWSAGDEATHFVVITSGLVKIVRPGSDGAIVGILGPRESIGEAAVLARCAYPADAIAATDLVQVVMVPGDFVRGMSDDPAISAALRGALVQHAELLNSKIAIMSAGSVPRRLAALFGCLADRFGDECVDGSTIIPVALSRAELAHLVGSTVETTIRTVSAWQKAGLLTTSAGGFVVYGDLVDECEPPSSGRGSAPRTVAAKAARR